MGRRCVAGRRQRVDRRRRAGTGHRRSGGPDAERGLIAGGVGARLHGLARPGPGGRRSRRSASRPVDRQLADRARHAGGDGQEGRLAGPPAGARHAEGARGRRHAPARHRRAAPGDRRPGRGDAARDALAATDDDLPALVARTRHWSRPPSTGELLQTFSDRMNAGPAVGTGGRRLQRGNPPRSRRRHARSAVQPCWTTRTRSAPGCRSAVAQAAAAVPGRAVHAVGPATLTGKGSADAGRPGRAGFPVADREDHGPEHRGRDQRPAADPARARAVDRGQLAVTHAGPVRRDRLDGHADAHRGRRRRPARRHGRRGRGGLSLFAADSQVGMWTFGAGHRGAPDRRP